MTISEIKHIHSFNSLNNLIKIEVEDQEGESWIFSDQNGDGFVDEISNTRTSSSFDGDYFQVQGLFQEAVWKATEKANNFIQALAHKGSIQLTTGFSAHIVWEPIYSTTQQYVGSLDKGTFLFLDINHGDNLKKLRLEPNGQGHFEFDVDGVFLDNFPFLNQAVKNLLKKAEHVNWCKSMEAESETSNKFASSRKILTTRDKVEQELSNFVQNKPVEMSYLFVQTQSGSGSILKSSTSSDEVSAIVPFNRFCSLPPQTVELSDYHFHPISNAVLGLFETSIPSQDDIVNCVKSAELLVHVGYHGVYDSRIATPLGHIILRPNLNLLRDDPDKFWNMVTKIPSAEAKARRLGLEQSGGPGNINIETLMGYIQSINSEAIAVEFKLLPDLQQMIMR